MAIKPTKPAFFSNKATLAALLVVNLLAVSVSAFAQVGPPAPPPKPEGPAPNPVNAMKDSFKRLFGKGEEDDIPPAGNTPAQPVVAPPPQQQMPKRPPLLDAPPEPNVNIAPAEASKENPPQKLITLDNPTNPLGLVYAENRLKQANDALKVGNLDTAESILRANRQWLIDATEAHINLYKTLSNLPSARVQAELEKQIALKFALLRDSAFFLNAKLNIQRNDNKAAIKDLVEVVKSQPRTDIGIEAYQLLQKIGFTEKLQLTQ